MNQLNVVQTEGYPLKAERLQEIEKAYAVFNSLGSLAGNLTIISGCETVGTNVKKGFVHINGEIVEFREAAVTPTSTVVIVEEQTNRAFKSGTIKNVYTIRYATFGTADTSWPWADFKRIDPITLLMQRLSTIETKLATIAEGAEANVQTDWDQSDASADSFLKGKPDLPIAVLYRGTYSMGDVNATDNIRTVYMPDLGTNNYMVVGSMVSVGSDWNADNDVMWMVRNKTVSSFQLLTREVSGNVQNLQFNYAIIPL